MFVIGLLVTPKHLTSGKVHLCDLAPRQHKSEEISPRWRHSERKYTFLLPTRNTLQHWIQGVKAMKRLFQTERKLQMIKDVLSHQMPGTDAESASGAVDSKFDSDSGQTNDLKIAIHSFPASHSALK